LVAGMETTAGGGDDLDDVDRAGQQVDPPAA
jgi:hypothetical protein